MSKNPEFFWDEELGYAACSIWHGDKVFIGTANCHPEDADMKSEKTGSEIAYHRAVIAAARNQLQNVQIELKGMKHLLATMEQSTRFNSKSYEAKRIYSHINFLNENIDTLKEIITSEKEFVLNYISEKEKFYKRIRANRMDNAD